MQELVYSMTEFTERVGFGEYGADADAVDILQSGFNCVACDEKNGEGWLDFEQSGSELESVQFRHIEVDNGEVETVWILSEGSNRFFGTREGFSEVVDSFEGALCDQDQGRFVIHDQYPFAVSMDNPCWLLEW